MCACRWASCASYVRRMTTQIAVKLPDTVVAALDELVAEGLFANRSAAVRAGIDLVTSQARQEAIDRAFMEGFQRSPETAEELRQAHRLGLAAIDEEPWEPWW